MCQKTKRRKDFVQKINWRLKFYYRWEFCIRVLMRREGRNEDDEREVRWTHSVKRGRNKGWARQPRQVTKRWDALAEISFGGKSTSLATDILLEIVMKSWACQVALVVKNLPAKAGDSWLDPWVRNIPWGRAWHHTPVLLPGESHGQRSLAGYSPEGHKELDLTEAT